MWKVFVQSGSREFCIHALTFIDWAPLYRSWKMSAVRWSVLWCAVRVDMITNGRYYEGRLVNVHLLSWSVFMVWHIVSCVTINKPALSSHTRIHQVSFGDTFQTANDKKAPFIFTFISRCMCGKRVGVSLKWKWQPVSCAIVTLVVACERIEGKDRILFLPHCAKA